MEINYLETFLFPDIPGQPYPVYSVSGKGKIFNLKSIIYPNPSSIKRFTRKKQLKFRSLQAKIFDGIVNIGYFDPLTVYKEFPIVIQNHLRLPGQKGAVYYLDYYVSELRLAIELDSDLHKADKDQIRDEYLLTKLGIKTVRLRNLEKESTQRKDFHLLTEQMRNITPIKNPPPFSFTDNIRLKKGL